MQDVKEEWKSARDNRLQTITKNTCVQSKGAIGSANARSKGEQFKIRFKKKNPRKSSFSIMGSFSLMFLGGFGKKLFWIYSQRNV